MHLADGRDPQPHPSTFDLMFQSFLPRPNSHLTTGEAQCISADGSKLLSELARVGAAHTHPQAARVHPLIHTRTRFTVIQDPHMDILLEHGLSITADG